MNHDKSSSASSPGSDANARTTATPPGAEKPWTRAVEIDPQQLLDSATEAKLKKAAAQKARLLDPDQVNLVAAEEEAAEEPLPTNKRRTRWGRLFAGAVAGLLTAAVAMECYRLISWGYQGHWLLGTSISVVVAGTLGAGVLWGLSSLRGLRQLRRRATVREQAELLLDSNGRHQAPRLLQTLTRQLRGSALEAPLQEALNEVDSVYNDAEIIRFVSHHAFQEQDRRAVQRVAKHSLETAALAGLSPLVSFDMLLVGWRNLRMLNEVAEIYAIAPGAASQWRLLKQVLHNLAFVGLSELTIDSGGALFGSSLTTQLSARMGQGLGAGLVTARIGLQAIELCRPLPYDQDRKPKLIHIQQQILGQLKDKL